MTLLYETGFAGYRFNLLALNELARKKRVQSTRNKAANINKWARRERAYAPAEAYSAVGGVRVVRE